MHAWDQQQDESGEAYKAFRAFLELGGSRTLDGAYRTSSRCKPGASVPDKRRAPGVWQGWAKKYRWRERALAYDVRDQQVAQQAHEAAVATVAATIGADRAARVLAHEQREHQIASRIGEVIVEMLEVGLVRRKVAKDDENGHITIFEPAKWNFGTMARLAKVFMQLGRTNLNMPVTVQQDAAPDAPYFDSSGEMDDAMPPGTVPVMPADANDRPPMTSAVGPRGGGLMQPKKPPRPGQEK